MSARTVALNSQERHGSAGRSKSYCLIDGAMAYDTLKASKVLSDPATPWVAPLLQDEVLRLAGPILIDITGIDKGSERGDEILRVWQAFPRQLHVSIITSDLPLQRLADHLRRFTSFRDSAGDTYGLRMGDCRVLAYLHTALSIEQWNALTAPMASWKISSRSGGDRLPLPLNEERLDCPDTVTHLHLSDEQIDKLIEAAQPDTLLAEVERQPTFDNERLTKSNHQTAVLCLEAWKSTGSGSRDALRSIAERVFKCALADRTNPAQVLQTAREVVLDSARD